MRAGLSIFSHEFFGGERSLYQNRNNILSKHCDIQRIRFRQFLPKTIGETCRLSAKDLEDLLFKNIMREAKKEFTKLNPEFNHFYYARMIRRNQSFQEALKHFIHIVALFDALRRQYEGSGDRGKRQLAAFDQLTLVDALVSVRPVPFALREWA